MSRNSSSTAISGANGSALSFTVKLPSSFTDSTLPPGPASALAKNRAKNSAAAARDTARSGANDAAVTPLITPRAAIWLTAA